MEAPPLFLFKLAKPVLKQRRDFKNIKKLINFSNLADLTKHCLFFNKLNFKKNLNKNNVIFLINKKRGLYA
jgi:hypothetical protein